MEYSFVERIQIGLNRMFFENQITFHNLKSRYEPTILELKYLENVMMERGITYVDFYDLKFTPLTAQFLVELLPKTDLTDLKIMIKDRNSLKVIEGIVGSSIKSLIINNSKIGQYELNKIVEYLSKSKVTELQLTNSNLQNNQVGFLVEKLKKLNIEMILMSNNITQDGAEMIAKSFEENSIIVKSVLFREREFLINASDNTIPHYKKKISLDLSDNPINNMGRYAVIKAMSTHQRIGLNFDKTEMIYDDETAGDNFVERIAEAFKTGVNNPTSGYIASEVANIDYQDDSYTEFIKLVMNINLYCFKIENMSYAELLLIVDALQHTDVKSLECSGRNMNPEIVTKLFEGLAKTQIERLVLSACDLKDNSTKIIAKNIHKTKITHLCLGSNPFEKVGILSIIDMIPTSNLIELDLEHSNIDDSMAILIAECMKYSKIVKLNLSNNNIELEGGKAFVLSLPETKIVSLDLSYNTIGDENVIAIFRIAVEKSICELDLQFDSISNNTLVEVFQIIMNYHLLILAFSDHDIPFIKDVLARNKYSLNAATEVVKKYLNGQVEFTSEFKNDLLKFQLVANSYYLWLDIPNSKHIKTKMLNKIYENFLQISGVIKEKLIKDDTQSFDRVHFVDLPSTIITKICSYLQLHDIPDED